MTAYEQVPQPAGPQDAEVPDDLRKAFAVAAGVCSVAGFSIGSAAVGFVAAGMEGIVWVWNTIIPDSWKAQGEIAWPIYADSALRETERFYQVSLEAVDAAWADLYRRGKLPEGKTRASEYLAQAAREHGWDKLIYHAPGGAYVVGEKNKSMYAERYLMLRGDYPNSVNSLTCFGWPKVPSDTEQSDVDSFIQTAQELIHEARIKPLCAAMDETLHWIVQRSTDYKLTAYQYGWRWCKKCQGLFFAGNSRGDCPAGGSHNLHGSASYGLVHNQAAAAGQHNWRWCKKCQGLFFAGNSQGVCPAGGSHDKSGSGDYALIDNVAEVEGQHNWRWCKKCQGLFFAGGSQGVCPAGGSHDKSGSGDYALRSDPQAAAWVDVAIEWETIWQKHMTHLVPFHSSERSFFIAYNKITGATTFASFTFSSGRKVTGIDVLAAAEWAAGWTHLVPFVQNNANYLIVYNSATGSVHFDRINADGTGTTTLNAGTWAKGWSQVQVLRGPNNANYLIVYNSATGHVRFDRIKDDASGSVNVKDGSWALGWEHLVPLSAGAGIPFLLVYDAGSGRARIDRFNGNSSTNVFDGVLLKGITHLERSGHVLIGYDKNSGYTELYRPRETTTVQSGYIQFELTGFDIVFNATWAANWSLIMPFKIPYVSGDFIQYEDRFVFYNAANGLIHVDTLG